MGSEFKGISVHYCLRLIRFRVRGILNLNLYPQAKENPQGFL